MTNNKRTKKNTVLLRNMQNTDLPIFFEQQLDTEANQMAAFTAKDPTDKDAFMAHWVKIRADTDIIIRTILFDNVIAGYILTHGWFGDPEISYWIGKSFWGQGIATNALHLFLEEITIRPLFARVVKDNIGSFRVLEKCGFAVIGRDNGFSNARGTEVEELILKTY
ncbi:MAG: GNAT family N-acetyltransferase [Chloroflexi bacterium]|nr:GNAT family N-acetyltransferase [Chloroflexota bacterium]